MGTDPPTLRPTTSALLRLISEPKILFTFCWYCHFLGCVRELSLSGTISRGHSSSTLAKTSSRSSTARIRPLTTASGTRSLSTRRSQRFILRRNISRTEPFPITSPPSLCLSPPPSWPMWGAPWAEHCPHFRPLQTQTRVKSRSKEMRRQRSLPRSLVIVILRRMSLRCQDCPCQRPPWQMRLWWHLGTSWMTPTSTCQSLTPSCLRHLRLLRRRRRIFIVRHYTVTHYSLIMRQLLSQWYLHQKFARTKCDQELPSFPTYPLNQDANKNFLKKNSS